jgi:hypothetical protein
VVRGLELGSTPPPREAAEATSRSPGGRFEPTRDPHRWQPAQDGGSCMSQNPAHGRRLRTRLPRARRRAPGKSSASLGRASQCDTTYAADSRVPSGVRRARRPSRWPSEAECAFHCDDIRRRSRRSKDRVERIAQRQSAGALFALPFAAESFITRGFVSRPRATAGGARGAQAAHQTGRNHHRHRRRSRIGLLYRRVLPPTLPSGVWSSCSEGRAVTPDRPPALSAVGRGGLRGVRVSPRQVVWTRVDRTSSRFHAEDLHRHDRRRSRPGDRGRSHRGGDLRRRSTDLGRTTQRDGVFCYTFFKAIAAS